MNKTIQKSLKCRNAKCGATCSPIDASFGSDNPEKCPNFIYTPDLYEHEKLNNKSQQQIRLDTIDECIRKVQTYDDAGIDLHTVTRITDSIVNELERMKEQV